MDQDYFKSMKPANETRSEFVERIKRDRLFGEFGSPETPEVAERRKREEMQYLERHDGAFLDGGRVSAELVSSLQSRGFDVGDPDGDKDVS